MELSHQPLLGASVTVPCIGSLWSWVLKTSNSLVLPVPWVRCFSSLVCHSLPTLTSLALLPSLLLSLTAPFSVSPCFCCPVFLPWLLSGILQLFSCPSLPPWCLYCLHQSSSGFQCCLALLAPRASAPSLCVTSSAHSSNDNKQRRWPLGKSFIGPNVATPGMSGKGVSWHTASTTEPNSSFNRQEGAEMSSSGTVFAPITAQTLVYTVTRAKGWKCSLSGRSENSCRICWAICSFQDLSCLEYCLPQAGPAMGVVVPMGACFQPWVGLILQRLECWDDLLVRFVEAVFVLFKFWFLYQQRFEYRPWDFGIVICAKHYLSQCFVNTLLHNLLIGKAGEDRQGFPRDTNCGKESGMRDFPARHRGKNDVD